VALSKAETKHLAALDRAIRHAVADRDLCRSYANHAGAARRWWMSYSTAGT